MSNIPLAMARPRFPVGMEIEMYEPEICASRLLEEACMVLMSYLEITCKILIICTCEPVTGGYGLLIVTVQSAVAGNHTHQQPRTLS